MKTWNVPTVEELNVELTANGCLPYCKEVCFIAGPQQPGNQPGTEDKTQDTEDSES